MHNIQDINRSKARLDQNNDATKQSLLIIVFHTVPYIVGEKRQSLACSIANVMEHAGK